MFIPLSIQLDLQIHQQNHTQDHMMSSILNQDNNEKFIPSTLITIPKLENSSGLSQANRFSELKFHPVDFISSALIWFIVLHLWCILNESTSTSQTNPLSNSFISSDFHWNLLNKLPNVRLHSGKDIDSIWSITTIPTRSHSRDWLSESSQVTFNLHPKLNLHPNAILNPAISNPNNDLNPNPIYKDSDSSNIELKEELPQLDEDSNFLNNINPSSRIPHSSEDLNQENVHSNDFNIFNVLENPLPSSLTHPDQSHELDFLL